jgi:hypothetical protein
MVEVFMAAALTSRAEALAIGPGIAAGLIAGSVLGGAYGYYDAPDYYGDSYGYYDSPAYDNAFN